MEQVIWSENLGAYVDTHCQLAIDGNSVSDELRAAKREGSIPEETTELEVLNGPWSVEWYEDAYSVVYEWPIGWVRAEAR